MGYFQTSIRPLIAFFCAIFDITNKFQMTLNESMLTTNSSATIAVPLCNLQSLQVQFQFSLPLHYGIRAMVAMTLRNLELCPSFSSHPNISDGNFNLDHQGVPKIQKSEFWNATYPSGFHRLDEPPEKISALQTHKRYSASHFQFYIVITMGKLAKNLIWS